MPSIASATIVDTILRGARNAFDVYEELSGGHWIGSAPESFLQASIAMAFKKLKDADDRLYLTLESSTKRIQADVDLKIDRRIVKMSERQRFDLLLWYKGGDPRAIIETKKAWNADSCTKDAKRIREWIRDKNNSICAGYLVAYTVAKGRKAAETIQRRFENIKERTDARGYKPLKPTVDNADGWRWDVACFEIRQ